MFKYVVRSIHSYFLISLSWQTKDFRGSVTPHRVMCQFTKSHPLGPWSTGISAPRSLGLSLLWHWNLVLWPHTILGALAKSTPNLFLSFATCSSIMVHQWLGEDDEPVMTVYYNRPPSPNNFMDIKCQEPINIALASPASVEST